MSAWMLEADYLEFIHDKLIAVLWPETEPIGEREQRERPLIESAAARPFHTLFGQDAYPSVFDKAVALFHSINANHAFLNGNKRTAVMAMDHFFIANDWHLLLENDEMYKIAEKTASYKERGLTQEQSLEEIADALGEFVIEMEVVRNAVGQQAEFLEIVAKFEKIRDLIRNNPFVTLRD